MGEKDKGGKIDERSSKRKREKRIGARRKRQRCKKKK
jgi:hypothetical protein